MATQGIFFAGRTIIIPGAYGFGIEEAGVTINLGALNVVMLVGTSEGGQPGVPLLFGAAGEAAALARLRGGNLATAIEAAWHPSPDANVNGADAVFCVRVDPATQSSAIFLDTTLIPLTAFTVTSRDWGKHTRDNQVGVLAGVADPTLRQIVVRKIGDGINQQSPDLGHILGLAYTGNGTATVAVSNVAPATMTVAVTGATDGTAGFTIDLTGKAVKTIAKLAAFLSAQAGFNVKVFDAPKMLSAWLDPTAAPAALSGVPTTLQAINGACVQWMNDFAVSVMATFSHNDKPVATLGPTFLTGGTDGVPTNTHWQNAFNVLGNEHGYVLVPLTADTIVHAKALAHVQQQSDIKVKHRRVAFLGHDIGDVVFSPDGTIDYSALATRIFNLNADRVVMATPGVELSTDDGDTLFPAYMLAAIMAGIKCGNDPQESLTNKFIQVQGLEGNYDPVTLEGVLKAAASPAIKEKGQGYKISKGQCAQLRSSSPLTSEPSVLHVADTILTNLEDILGKKYTGVPPTSNITIILNKIKGDVSIALREATKLGMLVAGNNPVTGAPQAAYRDISVTFSGGVYAVSFKASISTPGNYITILAQWTAVSGAA